MFEKGATYYNSLQVSQQMLGLHFAGVGGLLVQVGAICKWEGHNKHTQTKFPLPLPQQMLHHYTL